MRVAADCFYLIIWRNISSMEKRPGPLKNISTNMVRYISANSFMASGSPAWITSKATHMVNIIGIRHSRNNAPRINPMLHTTSANMTSQNDKVAPIPKGSGNLSVASLNAAHLATPWLRYIAPKTMRAARSITEYAIGRRGSLKRKFLIFSIIYSRIIALFFLTTSVGW